MTLNRRGFLAGLAAVAAAPLQGCDRPSHGPRLILLITLDTVRRRNLQAYGYARTTTPNLIAMSHRGFRFTNAFTHANETQTSHAVMLSGLYSHLTGSYRNNQRWVLPEGHQTLAQVLAAHGFHTAALIVLNSQRYSEDLEKLAQKDPNTYGTAGILHPRKNDLRWSRAVRSDR